MARAKQIEKKDNPQLYNIVENLCIASGLPTPKIYITPERQINAFATGRDAKHAAIAVTRGALERLNKTELEGVLGHELSHIGNRDILVSTVAAILAGVISLLADIFLRSLFYGGMGRRSNDDNNEGGQIFFFLAIALSILAPIGTMLIQLAISRRREALADASGVLLTRYPEGLISALQKIGADETPMASAKDSTAHMWIDNPFKGAHVSWWHRLLATHPPIQERIDALRKTSI
jgi:heat shock protein HtpX